MLRSKHYKRWFVFWLLLIMSMAALIGGPKGPYQAVGAPVASADCLHREQAGERHLAVTWFGADASPVITATSDFSLIRTAIVGTLRCGATGERIVEWNWGKLDAQPTVTWYELADTK